MRVDVASYKVCSFSLCGLKISLIVLRVVCHFFFVLFFYVFYFSYSSVLFWFCYYFLSKPIAILEKSDTLTRTLPFFFPLYQCQPVTTTAALDPTSLHHEAYGCRSSMEGNGQGTTSVKLISHYDQQNYQHTLLSISKEK